MADKNVVKFKTKNQKQANPITLDPEDRVAVGNKPKSSIYDKGPKLLQTRGIIVHLNLKPSIPANPDQSLPEPKKSSLYAIPIRENKRPLSYKIKLDLPEQENVFYQTEKHRQAYIEEQLRHVLTDLGLSYYGDIILEEYLDLIQKNGWNVDVSIQEAS